MNSLLDDYKSIDAAGRVETLTDSLSGSGRTTSFGYDGASRLKTITRPNGVVTTNTYQAQRGWLTDVRHAKGTDLSFSTYTRSPAGRVATETAPGFSRTYNYDGAARLTSTVDGATTRTYTFDANSNRCSTAATCDGSYAYDDADRITASPFGSGYEYDSHGNLTGIASKGATFEYDGWDHATKIKPDTATSATTETLAPSGRVIRRLVPGLLELPAEDTVYGFAGDGDSPAYSRQALLGIPIPLGAVTSYISGPGGLLTIDTAGTAVWPLANGHGDIVGTTDGAGAFTANPVTDEFGVGDVPASRLGYLGGAQRFATGGDLKLIRMGVRLYDPALGRFLQVDPIEGGSANSYDYARQDCVNSADPDGLRSRKLRVLGKFAFLYLNDPLGLCRTKAYRTATSIVGINTEVQVIRTIVLQFPDLLYKPLKAMTVTRYTKDLAGIKTSLKYAKVLSWVSVGATASEFGCQRFSDPVFGAP